MLQKISADKDGNRDEFPVLVPEMAGDGLEVAQHAAEDDFYILAAGGHERGMASSLDEIPVSGSPVHPDEVGLHAEFLRLYPVLQPLADDGHLRAGVDDGVMLLSRKPEGHEGDPRLAEAERYGLPLHAISPGSR